MADNSWLIGDNDVADPGTAPVDDMLDTGSNRDTGSSSSAYMLPSSGFSAAAGTVRTMLSQSQWPACPLPCGGRRCMRCSEPEPVKPPEKDPSASQSSPIRQDAGIMALLHAESHDDASISSHHHADEQQRADINEAISAMGCQWGIPLRDCRRTGHMRGVLRCWEAAMACRL